MQLPEIDNTIFLEKIGIFNSDSVRKEFSSDFTKIKDIKVYADSTDSTTHTLITLDFTHIDSLYKIKPFSDYDFSLKDGAAGQKIFTQFIPPVATGFGVDTKSFRVSYKYTFPGDIITHNANIENKNTLTWNYALDEIGRGKTISVTYRPFKLKETPYWIYILAGMVLLLVIIFLFRKKR